jgi:preprotein translocase YajC subunit
MDNLLVIILLNYCSYLIPSIVLALFFYIALYLPAKKQRSLLLKLKLGDAVVTHSGLVGTLVRVEKDWCIIALENNAHARIARDSIAAQL